MKRYLNVVVGVGFLFAAICMMALGTLVGVRVQLITMREWWDEWKP